jgi:hypothetical protein
MPTRPPSSQPWRFLTEDTEAILAGLREGEFEHIYPASPTLFDRFLSYLDHVGVRDTLDTFPDHRQRRSIPVRFLTQTLLVRPLCAVSSLAQLGPVLSASPEILHLLGFNAHQIAQGFRANARQRPFDEETLANFAATVTAQDCLEHCLVVLPLLLAAHPEYFQGATLVVDSKGVYAPAGKANGKGERLEAVALKVCTLSVVVEGEAVPLVWLFAPQETGEVALGKQLLARALPLLVPAGATTLLLDAGYLDGAWQRSLHQQWGLRVGVRMREDLRLHAAAFGELERQELRRPRPPSPWHEAPPPKRKGKPPPRRRVALGRGLEQWEAAGGPVDVLAFRDTSADGKVDEWAVAFFGNTEEDPLVLLGEWRTRWTIEEFFMVADRYRHLGRLFPCREGFAKAWVHFAFLAHLLLWCFDHYHPEEPLPEPKSGGLLVIRGPYYAIISVGRLLQIVLDHHLAWQSKRAQVFARLGLNDPSP